MVKRTTNHPTTCVRGKHVHHPTLRKREVLLRIQHRVRDQLDLVDALRGRPRARCDKGGM